MLTRRRQDRGRRREQHAGCVDERDTGDSFVNVHRQPGGNTISVVNSRSRSCCRSLQANLPKGIEVTTLTDLTTTDIQASVDDVEFELMLTIGLVVLVIFLFLRNFYATIIPQRRGTAVAGRHLCRDVYAGLQPGQSLADGADHLDWLRRRRRHRHGGEHLPLPWKRATPPMQAALQGRGADRLHHSFR